MGLLIMAKLIDSNGNVIKESTRDYIEDLYEVLYDSVYDVTEEDEVRFGQDLYIE